MASQGTSSQSEPAIHPTGPALSLRLCHRLPPPRAGRCPSPFRYAGHALRDLELTSSHRAFAHVDYFPADRHLNRSLFKDRLITDCLARWRALVDAHPLFGHRHLNCLLLSDNALANRDLVGVGYALGRFQMLLMHGHAQAGVLDVFHGLRAGVFIFSSGHDIPLLRQCLILGDIQINLLLG